MERAGTVKSDLICLSHLRWDFVYQRPQHLMTRFARERRVFFFEEPFFDTPRAELEVSNPEGNVWVVRPHLPNGISELENESAQQGLITELIWRHEIQDYLLWFYTPMALGFTQQLKPHLVIYDCMDELSAFLEAPPKLLVREAELFQRAQLVFTGGHSLYLEKSKRHPRVYEFPSAVDQAHFAQARQITREPADQAAIARPRLGYFGVIDERMDLELIAGIADARPEWHLIVVGPVVKVDPAALPQRTNIHYLGGKAYAELPHYLAGWDVALLPFARNKSTRFISPTKTPEYLAGGKPVVSTSIRDVVAVYGELGLVQIADTVSDFVAAVEFAVTTQVQDAAWRARVDKYLAQLSWDKTWAGMSQLIERELEVRQVPSRQSTNLEFYPSAM